ncbi:hypothetical protein [Nocardiopsis sp. CNR-923]|uniref:hypothetical protein n=1 Tax=Nocardiopsis sp. CNR-923 TaxID=1904965 RepID=UPI0021CCB112|nr:hypothetical protein [Nocardiopsis sp. CNR-923]
MNNESLERLRPLGAWVLLGAVGASLLSELIRLIVVASDFSGGFAAEVESAASGFFGPWNVVLLVAAVAWCSRARVRVRSRRRSSSPR